MKLTIPFDEAGEGAVLTYSIDDLKALRADFGERYVHAIFSAAAGLDVVVLEKALEIGTKGGSWRAAEHMLTVEQMATKVADALSLRLYGKVTAEMDA